jgi:hypothetical protein
MITMTCRKTTLAKKQLWSWMPQDNPMLKNNIKNEKWKKQKQSPESIRVSIANSWLRSWDQAIFIERKSKTIKKLNI